MNNKITFENVGFVKPEFPFNKDIAAIDSNKLYYVNKLNVANLYKTMNKIMKDNE